MNELRWNAVRQFYMESFGISPELVDLMASNEILLMCVSGSSNSSISRILNIDEESINEIISTIFDFDGWKEDLDFSPFHIYEQDSNRIAFIGSIVDLFVGTAKINISDPHEDDINIDKIELMYKICSIYKSIEDKLEKEWI